MIRKRRKKINYINNRDFFEEMKKHRELMKDNPAHRASDYIGKCILQICTKLSEKPNFSGYSYRDEMIDDAIINCINAINKFNPARTENPFAYFTMIAYNSFVYRIKEEKRQQYFKLKNFERMIINDDEIFIQEQGMSALSGNSNFNDLITSFENSVNKSKKEKKTTKKGIEKYTG